MFTIVTWTTSAIVTSNAALTLSSIAFLLLLVALIQKEIATGLVGRRAHRLNGALSTIIVPLSIVAVIVSFMRVMDVVR